METLTTITQKLGKLFVVEDPAEDPSFSFLVPMVYEEISLEWRSYFELVFCTRVNGVMLCGADPMETVFCAALPTPQMLDAFLQQAQPGDMFFGFAWYLSCCFRASGHVHG